MTPPPAFISLAFIAAMSLSGCSWLADVSSTMRVDTGLEPENIDKNVRFRTTYYFRVLTGCSITKPDAQEFESGSAFAKRTSGTFVPLNDSLYRFRMTGQAAALFNKVHFESGVLRKEQIDPFGSAVKYNEHTNSFIPLSAEEMRADAKTEAARRDIETFRKIYKDLSADNSLTTADRNTLFQKLITMIEDRLEQLKGSRPFNASSPTSAGYEKGTDSSKTAMTAMENQLTKTETELGQAKTQLKNSQKALDEAKDKVDKINNNLNSAKDALKSQTSDSEEAKRNIATLSAELSAAQVALSTAEDNLKAADKLVTALTAQTTAAQKTIGTSHTDLVTAKGQAVTSLQDLSKKVEALLTELGAAKSTSQPQSAAACNGKPSENKYYLLGPEGGKELDPHDRLLLALSVDSKPLISALQQLSERKFQTAGANIKTLEDLLEERGRILDTRTALQKAERDAGTESGPTDQSKLQTVLDTLRKSYVSTPSKTAEK